MSEPTAPPAETCYRHPDRPAGVRCQRCDRHICSECMRQASVGFHCPECVKGNTQRVYNSRNLPGSEALVTRALIGANVLVWLLGMLLEPSPSLAAGRGIAEHIALNGYPIDVGGEWWRVITSGFGHFGVFHLGVNMYSIWILGRMIERSMGPAHYALVYFVSMIGGSAGALLLSPLALTMGASGAVFGLLGATVLLFRSRGIGLQESGLVPILLINAFISLRGDVSLGGHLGGFIAGLVLGAIFFGVQPGKGPLFGRDQRKPVVVSVILGVLLFVGAIVASGGW